MTIARARPAPAAEALLADGRVVRLRMLGPEDGDAVRALHARACDESVRLRFFSVRREVAGRYAEHLATATDHHLAMVAVAGGTVIGVASAEPNPTEAECAEVAVLVDDARQHTGSWDPCLRWVLAPRGVVVVVGASRSRVGTSGVGRAVLDNLLAGGYLGRLAVVNSHAQPGGTIAGVLAYRRVAEVPFAADLAVLAIPAAAVPEEECGRVGVAAAVVLSSGFAETGEARAHVERELVATAHRYGMRLVGPNCFGVLNTDPAVRLDATFGTVRPLPGRTALYVESIGNPRRFRRIAREVSRTRPVVVLRSGRSALGARAGRSHTAAAAAPDAVLNALLADSGVIGVDSTAELLDVAALLESQPVPAGTRIAVLGNAGGPGSLAADHAVAAGATVPALSPDTLAAVRAAAPGVAAADNPIDLGAAAPPDAYAATLQALGASGEVDAVLVLHATTRAVGPAEVLSAVGSAAQRTGLPVAGPCWEQTHPRTAHCPGTSSANRRYAP
jgi:acyl-CoA synthetase (NDP forming)